MEAKSTGSDSPSQSKDLSSRPSSSIADSDQFIELNPPSPSPKKTHAGLSLGLKLGANGGRLDNDAKDTSEAGAMMREAEAEVLVIFELPDGSQVEEMFKMGQSVEVLKSFVASEIGMSMEGQQVRIRRDKTALGIFRARHYVFKKSYYYFQYRLVLLTS